MALATFRMAHNSSWCTAKVAHKFGLSARGEDPEKYASFLQAFSHGMPPHGGFAIGLERWTAGLSAAANVRQVTAFQRDIHRLAS